MTLREKFCYVVKKASIGKPTAWLPSMKVLSRRPHLYYFLSVGPYGYKKKLKVIKSVWNRGQVKKNVAVCAGRIQGFIKFQYK